MGYWTSTKRAPDMIYKALFMGLFTTITLILIIISNKFYQYVYLLVFSFFRCYTLFRYLEVCYESICLY